MASSARSTFGTPPRPGPGLYPQTPAPKTPYPPPPSFHTSTPQYSQYGRASQMATSTQRTGPPATAASRPSQAKLPAEIAADAINLAAARDANFPSLDAYYSQGHSSDYEIASSPTWAPFHKVRMHNIPDDIFRQYNRAEVSTMMGLFAHLKYAWATIDNALYLWDYTKTTPDLLGHEGFTGCITAVTIGKPKQGVFLNAVKDIITVATTTEVVLLGFGIDTQTKQMNLFQTGMSVSIRGIDVTEITHSDKTGRIFFAGRSDAEIYELSYQQQDGWFSAKCSKEWRTRSAYKTFSMAVAFSAPDEYIHQMRIDDSRDLLYTLSSRSTIQVYHLPPPNSFNLALTRTAVDIYNGTNHLVGLNELLNPRIRIVSISIIPRPEASRFSLCATTATGYRIFLSTTTPSSYLNPTQFGSPSDMRAAHVRLPPDTRTRGSPRSMQASMPPQSTDMPIRTLTETRSARRLPPGYFFCLHNQDPKLPNDQLFVSAPDSARLYNNPSTNTHQPTEIGTWIDLNSRAEAIDVSIAYKPPIDTSVGFGNELATQFNGNIPEIAVLTNTGIHILKRRRLVDIFAALIKQGGSNTEGFQTEIHNFIKSYGRHETLATAVAVACGQGTDSAQDSRQARINDPEVLEVARKTIIDHGGKPSINQNTVNDRNAPLIERGQPSPRHYAFTLYISRLLRAMWRTPIVMEKRDEKNGYLVLPNVPLEKLRIVQEDLSQLQRFFNQNKTFIRGLGGPDDLPQTGTREDEEASQLEHLALHSLTRFVSNTIEGISFVLVMFEENVADLVPLLPEASRPEFINLTFEQLFSSSRGVSLAKEVVKALVNRNIAKGSNVETVAEALRRRCGSFCSSDDVVIFKAQEQLKRAREAGPNAELARNLLNESLRLFEEVAHSLPSDYLQNAAKQFTDLKFFAGAIQLVLRVAHESDKANEALSWMADGKPDMDPRKEKFDARTKCYDLIHDIILAVDQSTEAEATFVEGRPSVAVVRKAEAYDVISRANDEAFLTNLYDWYLLQGWQDRILATESPFIVKYLQRKSADDIQYADLLWRYYGQTNQFQDAAQVQLQLAQSAFDLPLDRRIEYLSRARANASTYTQGGNRKTKQKLLQDISELLDLANIQDEILQRLRDEPRMPAEGREEILREVDGPVLEISTLFNKYATSAGYYDICLLIYQVADHRDASAIKQTWQQLLQQAHDETEDAGEAQPFETISQQVIDLGAKLRLSESTFPVPMLLPLLLTYSYDHQRNIAPAHWVINIFLQLEVTYEQLFDVLEIIFYSNDRPFVGGVRRVIVEEVLYVVERWWHESTKAGGIPFGSEQGVARVEEMFETCMRNARDAGVDADMANRCRIIREHIAAYVG